MVINNAVYEDIFYFFITQVNIWGTLIRNDFPGVFGKIEIHE